MLARYVQTAELARAGGDSPRGSSRLCGRRKGASMLLNMSIVVLENTVTPEGLMLYLAVLCVLMVVVIGAGIFFRRAASR